MYAPAKPDYPILAPADLVKFDAFLFGVPTRYGNFPAQWKVCYHPLSHHLTILLTPPFRGQAFWDATGQLWASGGLYGKSAGLFISTAGLGGGQESTAIAAMSTLAHHGISFVPLGYKHAFAQLTSLSEAHGGEFLITIYSFISITLHFWNSCYHSILSLFLTLSHHRKPLPLVEHRVKSWIRTDDMVLYCTTFRIILIVDIFF